MSNCFQRFVGTYYLLLDYLKACQNVSIGNVRILNLGFTTTTAHDVLDKNSYQHNTS